MVFLQYVSWPDNPVLVRRPEGGMGPSIWKSMKYIHIYYDVPLVTGCMGGVTGYDVGKTRYDAQFC